ncbi:glycoside hydrolase family 140 protein [Microcoleus sp. FACHB-SPT15]|uniref:glycoside hydrolase family 140 protein n=1 Tax=Microcoleus sp. FACHB-SPT15 TaxID=2692830 RepID=UPI00177AD25E|nr:glycoside hydrolase family 140 protein [Microcoleus sp. FACHB-SPT15]MBD1809587.1 glycoside hydrolase family 140 protein [Microcoleus sp. FACHB-SPT15]
MTLRVSDNQRFLVRTSDGQPFLWLGDTAWELFHRLTREEASSYLENRREKGFTVIQAVAVAELDGLNTPNAYGTCPFYKNNLTTPNDEYFQHVDYVVDAAEKLGLWIGFLPTWGSYVVSGVINEGNARTYGHYLGNRYKNRTNIIWILGGDRNPGGKEKVWREMVAGLAEGDGGKFLMTYHPVGGSTSSTFFHNEEWLDFNMLQSGHSAIDLPNYTTVCSDYAKSPAKPTLDGESRYEDHPINWNPGNGYFRDYDVRQAAYWALFAGAFGHTYGHHSIWQMWAPGRKGISSPQCYWYDALNRPGAANIIHIRNLLLSRPFLSRVPDQSIISSNPGTGANHSSATRGDGYLFIYASTGQNFTIHLGKISGTHLKAWWYDPRNGDSIFIGEYANSCTGDFEPPGTQGRGNDWVLVVDDASKNFSPPGKI